MALPAEHAREAALILKDLENILNGGERTAHGGDCSATFRSIVHASRLLGQARAHRDEAGSLARRLDPRMVAASQRLQRLEMGFSGNCVEG